MYRLPQVVETTCDDPRVGGGGEASESNHSDVGSDKEAEQVEEEAGLGAGRGEGGVLTEACGSTPHDPMFGDVRARDSLHCYVHSLQMTPHPCPHRTAWRRWRPVWRSCRASALT
jgi:hypothetical protein